MEIPSVTVRVPLSKHARPLLPSEVPEHARRSFDFDSQQPEFRDTNNTRVLTILRTCNICGIVKRIRVTSVRTAIRKHGDVTGRCVHCAVSDNQWKGGRWIDRKGYVRVRKVDHPNALNGYVFEHRLVMEQHLGRLLSKNETVHHRNGVKTDNRVENLELWSKAHSDGQRYTDLDDEHIRVLIEELKKILLSRQEGRE